MKNNDMLKMVRQEVRKLLEPVGLFGERGPVKDVRCLVRNEIKKAIKEMAVQEAGQAIGSSQS